MNWTCWDLIDGKLLWLALRSVENELNIFCTLQILSFHTCLDFELHAKVCVRSRFDLLNIFTCLEGWSGLLLAAAAAASSSINPNGSGSSKQPGEAPNAARDGHPCGEMAPRGLTGAGGVGLGEQSPGD